MEHDFKDTVKEKLIYDETSDGHCSMPDTLKEPQESGLLDIASIDPKKAPEYFDSLKEHQIWGYGVGHVLNDLAAGMWF